jgi:hypothetical protein
MRRVYHAQHLGALLPYSYFLQLGTEMYSSFDMPVVVINGSFPCWHPSSVSLIGSLYGVFKHIPILVTLNRNKWQRRFDIVMESCAQG